MKIIDLRPDAAGHIREAAALLVEGFGELSPEAWPTLEVALEEVYESFAPDRLSRVAVDEAGAVVGWIGGIRQYEGKVWELHPLVVNRARQGQGIGRALVQDFERLVAGQGACTIMLGTDDETNLTSLGGVDLYADVPGHLAAIRNLGRHPFEFYRKLGYTVVGVLPDANGPGKPDIFMAKRVVPL